MNKYVFLLSYVGQSFCGWQRQKKSTSASSGKPSIQETIEQALGKITQQEITVVGSGRTDAGVHATGQVAHCVIKDRDWDLGILHRGLNGTLPRSIQVLGVQKVPLEFHAQRSALKKQYSYYFQQGPCSLPHMEPFSWWIRKPLNLEAMQTGLSFLKGKHDFKPFQSSGAKPGPTVREILEAEVSYQALHFPGEISFEYAEKRLGLVRVRVLGTGFLKQMVRGIAGTLLQIGENRRPPSDMQRILETLDRGAVGPTAPARALWLERVWYPENLDILGQSRIKHGHEV